MRRKGGSRADGARPGMSRKTSSYAQEATSPDLRPASIAARNPRLTGAGQAAASLRGRARNARPGRLRQRWTAPVQHYAGDDVRACGYAVPLAWLNRSQGLAM